MSNMKPQRGKTPRKNTQRKQNVEQTDPVEVYCRIRPLIDNPDDSVCVKVLSQDTIVLTADENSHAGRNGALRETRHTFGNVFDEFSTQKSVFDYTALPLVDDVIHGKNALLFAYGITSSGKTYTMAGTPQDQGILPRCLDVLFNSIDDLQAKKYVFKPDKMNGFEAQTEADAMMERQRRDITPKMLGTKTPGTPREKDKFDHNKHPRIRDPSTVQDVEVDNSYAVFVSYVEIYNNYIYDLLEELPYDPITGYKPPQSKILREDGNHVMYVSGVVEVEVKSTEEAYEVLWKGQKRRKVAHTALNTESSRSHSVFNIRLVQAPLDPLGEEVITDKEKIAISQMSLVDLAGSERSQRTGNHGDRLREAGNINQSLMVLRTCIEALRENQKNGINKIVPYRDSRLTHLFKNYFDGEGKVRMIVCVNPRANEYDETIHVMKFAELTQDVQVARSQQVRFDVGFTPGRRRLNKQYKDALSKARADGADPGDIPIPEPLVYSLGAVLPSIEYMNTGDDVSLEALIEALKTRELKRGTLLTDYAGRQESFRTHIVEMEDQNKLWKREIEELRTQLSSHNTEMGKMQRRVRNLEKNNDQLQRTINMYEQERRDLEREIGEKEWHILQTKTERDRMQQDYKAKLALTKHTLNRQMEQTRKKMKEETAAQLRAKQHKLDMVKNILNQEQQDSDNRSGRPNTRLNVTGRLVPARSEPDLSSSSTTTDQASATPIRTGHVRAMTAAYTQPTNKAVPRTSRAKSPPPTKPKPSVNPRYHRRSKSSHEVWIDHRPAGTVPTVQKRESYVPHYFSPPISPRTVLQPKMKKKKSVTKLTEKDVTGRDAGRYVLTTQGVDSDGDVATRLVKGDIMPTAGGGAAVIFNDVETLKQTSPGDRKRKSSPTRRPQDYEGEWTDVETRCKVAIEGHGAMKRTKTSVV